MSSEKKSSFSGLLGPISLGAVMFSSYVGPGFASGTQTVSYFLTKGWVGVFWGVIVCGLLAMVVNLVSFELNRVYRPRNYRESADTIWRLPILRYILGTFTDVMGILSPILSIAAQISAASLLLNNLWGVPLLVGTLIFCIIIVVFALFGAKVLRYTGTALTLAILGVTLYIAITGIPNAWGDTMAFIAQRSQPEDYGFSKLDAWYIMITFMGNFLCGANACVTASRGVLVTRKDVVISAFTNIFLCVISTIAYTVVFAAGMPSITQEALPTLWAIQNICGGARGAQVLYAVLALSAMLSTGIALLFAVANRWESVLAKVWKKSTAFRRKLVITLLFIFICTYGSSFGILTIVYYGFVYLGKVSWPILCLLPCFAIPIRIYLDKKAGLIDKDGYYIHADPLEEINK